MELDMELNGKVAVLIGGSAGVGRAYTLALAGAGATVIAAARSLGSVGDEPAAKNTLAHVVKGGDGLSGRVYAQVCDAQIESDIERTIEQTVVNFGRIDVLVNCAALMTQFEPFQIGREDWDRIMQLNVRGPYVAMRYAAPHMMRQRRGSIINITARAATLMPKGQRVYDGTLLYAVSKAALNRLMFSVSEELKPHGVAVNALSPGIVATDTALAATPNLREFGGKEPTAEVLGPALLHLAKQTAQTLTGQVLYTDDFGKTWP
jgi:NAD(P)-dependent dehydrogenase (short-subunit alcohol dehydrogenase family)